MKLKKYLYKQLLAQMTSQLKIRLGSLLGIIVAKIKQKEEADMATNGYQLKITYLCQFFNLNRKVSLKKLTYTACKIVQRSLFKLVKKK